MQIPKLRILCIDNNASRNLAIYLLQRAGYEVRESNSIAAGVTLARSDEPFDLYLLNHKLVDGSAIDSCDSYHEFSLNTPILFYSTVLYPYQQSGIACRLHNHTVEPIAVSEVVGHASSLITNRRRREMEKGNKNVEHAIIEPL